MLTSKILNIITLMNFMNLYQNLKIFIKTLMVYESTQPFTTTQT